MSATSSRLLHSRMQTNSLNAGPSTRPGVMINGGGNQGKTETTAEAAASFEEMWLHLRQRCDPEPLPGVRDLRCTVAYVQTPENVWREIASRIPEPENAGHRPELGERKRQTASIVVWARLSEGEHVFAPHPMRDRQDPKNRNAWRLSDYAFWARIEQGTTRQVDDQLLALLDQYIAHLAPIIDLEGEVPKGSSPWS